MIAMFNVAVHQIENTIVIELSDKKTQNYVELAEKCDILLGMIETAEHNVVIDFTNLSTFTSLLIGKLVFSHGYLKKKGLVFGICGLNEHLKRVLRMTNLDRYFVMGENVEEVMKLLSKTLTESK